MTQRDEIADAVDAFGWDALESPQRGEMIYKRHNMLVFAQFNSDGGLREATLRKMVARQLSTSVEHIDWTDRIKMGRVVRWFSDYGESAAEARELARRQRARR